MEERHVLIHDGSASNVSEQGVTGDEINGLRNISGGARPWNVGDQMTAGVLLRSRSRQVEAVATKRGMKVKLFVNFKLI